VNGLGLRLLAARLGKERMQSALQLGRNLGSHHVAAAPLVRFDERRVRRSSKPGAPVTRQRAE